VVEGGGAWYVTHQGDNKHFLANLFKVYCKALVLTIKVALVSHKVTTEYFFPVRIDVADLEGAEVHNQTILELISKLKQLDPEGYVGNIIKGWRSDKNLREYPELAPFFTEVDAIMASIIKDIGLIDSYRLKSKTAWLNVYPPDAYITSHVHPNAHYSIAYYVKADEFSGSLKFIDPCPQREMVMHHFKQETPEHYRAIKIKPKAGQMVIFPAWLRHETEPSNLNNINKGEVIDERVCLSINYTLTS
jgi:uncharacterized protein (TIGR02466 family)